MLWLAASKPGFSSISQAKSTYLTDWSEQCMQRRHGLCLWAVSQDEWNGCSSIDAEIYSSLRTPLWNTMNRAWVCDQNSQPADDATFASAHH